MHAPSSNFPIKNGQVVFTRVRALKAIELVAVANVLASQRCLLISIQFSHVSC